MRRRRKRRAAELTPLIDVLFILLFAALIQARGATLHSSSAAASADKAAEPTDGSLTDAAAQTQDEPPGDAAVLDSAELDEGDDSGARPERDALGVASDNDALGDANDNDALGVANDDDALGDASDNNDGNGDSGAAGLDAPAGDAGNSASGGASSASYGRRSLRAAETLARSTYGRSGFIVEVAAAGELRTITAWIAGEQVRRDSINYQLLAPDPVQEVVYRGTVDPRYRICAIVRDHLDMIALDLDIPFADMLILITTDKPYDEMPLAMRHGLTEDSRQCADG
ncbi:MAG: hypothetical protein AAGC55_23275, partial [Myxococcota bacterium]